MDIEKIDDRHLDAAPAVFTPRELAWMDENPVERFFSIMDLEGKFDEGNREGLVSGA